MKITIDPTHFSELIRNGYSLDMLFLLKLIQEQYDISPLISDPKIAVLYAALKRKALISEKEDKLTTRAEELIAFIDSKEAKKLLKKKPPSSDFDEFWKAYPGTDTFTYAGRTFTGSRNLRAGKDECRIKFDKIILEGEYTPKQITEAMKYDVQQKKEASIKQGTNKLTYMQNSLTYLNQRSFEPFIELIQQGAKPIDESSTPIFNTTKDI